MWSKLVNIILSIVVVCGGIFFYISKQDDENTALASEKNVQQLTEDSQSQKAQIQQLEEDLEKAKQEAEGLHHNIDDYLNGFDDMMKKTSTALPALQYSNEEEHQVLLYAKAFLQKNSYGGNQIIPQNEIVTFLESVPTDQPLVYGVRIETYRPQYHKYQLPSPTDMSLGGYMTMQVAKDKNSWKVIGEINKIM